MIVDCHTQLWDTTALPDPARARADGVEAARHLEAVDPVDRAIVLGFKSRYLGTEIPNHFVAEYVRRYSDKLIGFAGIDPTVSGWADELAIAQEELGLRGVVVSPPLQDFHPTDTRAMRLYEACLERRMPVLFEHHHRNPAAKLEYARPVLIDEIARELPELRIVISQMGYPWVDETVVLLAKHPCVFADIAGLLPAPWRSYNALLAAYEQGVMDKLLFGSDYPYRAPAECIEALYSINQISSGTELIAIPREQLRRIVERDALAVLGIERPARPSPARTAALIEDE